MTVPTITEACLTLARCEAESAAAAATVTRGTRAATMIMAKLTGRQISVELAMLKLKRSLGLRRAYCDDLMIKAKMTSLKHKELLLAAPVAYDADYAQKVAEAKKKRTEAYAFHSAALKALEAREEELDAGIRLLEIKRSQLPKAGKEVAFGSRALKPSWLLVPRY